MILSIEGNDDAGFWVNLGPGVLRVGAIYPTLAQADAMLEYHSRTCGNCMCAITHASAEVPPLIVPVVPAARHRWFDHRPRSTPTTLGL